MLVKDQYVREMWEYHSCERSKVKNFREDAVKEKQGGIQGQWQRESPAKEYLEQVKCRKDINCTPRMMKQAFLALKGGDWEEYTNIFRVQAKATGWAFDRIQEAFEKVGNDEARKLSTVQKVMSRSTDYLRRMIDPAGGQGSVTMSYLCPHCNSFPLEDYVWLEETHQLVVCDLWKNTTTKLALGGANRRKC